MKEDYHLCENSGDWVYEDAVPSVETWKTVLGLCSSVRDKLGEEGVKKGRLEADGQPSTLGQKRSESTVCASLAEHRGDCENL